MRTRLIKVTIYVDPDHWSIRNLKEEELFTLMQEAIGDFGSALNPDTLTAVMEFPMKTEA